MDATPTPPSHKKRYHHGRLRDAALQRGREIVAQHGPDALTLRGLARALGVTAPALVYHFGSRAGLCSAVAASVLEEMKKEAFDEAHRPAHEGPISPANPGWRLGSVEAERIAAAWIGYAERNPLLYRLATGETWRAQPRVPTGVDPGGLRVPSPRKVLQGAFTFRTRRYGLPKGEEALSEHLAFTIHGLALARMDGAGVEAVNRAIGGLLAASPPVEPPRAQPGS